jgi:type VI secretion system peptidoglycan-associated protein
VEQRALVDRTAEEYAVKYAGYRCAAQGRRIVKIKLLKEPLVHFQLIGGKTRKEDKYVNRQTGMLFIIAALGSMVIGCVSTGKYEKMEMSKNQEIAALQDKVGALEKQNTSLITNSQQSQKQYDALMQGLSKEVEKGQLQVRQYKNMLSVDLAEQIFFDSGSATLKEGGKDVLKTVGGALKGYENKIIRVVGHTDNVPVLKSPFPSNWELSVARATTVVRFLQEVGVAPERMIAAGRGEYYPVAPNDTPEGRQKNRRIEIMLIDQSLADELAKPDK